MDVEYTGRHEAVVTDAMRATAGPFLDRLGEMVGRGATAHVVLATEKNRQSAEVTVKTKAHDLVGLAETTAGLETALRLALDKVEAQAVKFKEKRSTEKRRPKDEKTLVEPALERGGKSKRTALLATPDSPLDEVLGLQPDLAPGPGTAANGNGKHAAAEAGSGADHSSEPHVTRSIDAVALRPMSLEEAVKELETRNRELFVFRDRAGLLRILHCRRDHTLELIELP